MPFDGTYVNGVPIPTIGSTGWGDEVNDFLTQSGRESVNVKLAPYGATGDGSTDDTAAIQAAITATATAGGAVYFPPGVYAHTALTMTTNTRLVGAGATISEFTPNTNGVVLKYTPSTGTAITVTANAVHNGPLIEHIGMLGPSAGGSTIGLFLDGSGSVMQVGSVKSVRVKGFGTGIKLNNTYQTSLLDCYCDGNGLGLQFTNNANANGVIGGGYRENVTGIHIAGSASIYVSPATTVESNTSNGLLVDGANVSALVIGGHYENNPRGIYFNATGSDTIADSVIRGAYIAVSSTAALEVNRTSNLDAELIFTNAQTITLGALAQFCHIRTSRPPGTYTDGGNFNLLEYLDSGVDGYHHIVSSAGLQLGNVLQMVEVSAPAAAAANGVRIYARDNGAGKTQIVARFNTGAVQVIASEP
jgi:hypothetical protein